MDEIAGIHDYRYVLSVLFATLHTLFEDEYQAGRRERVVKRKGSRYDRAVRRHVEAKGLSSERSRVV